MANSNKLKEIITPIQNELNSFELSLMETINHEENFLCNDLHNFIFSNPKRLRPIFIFLFAKILNIKSQQKMVENIAIITELIHSASLIHDDIIDEEKIRRNNPTFYKKYGSKLAVLEGDLLLSLALEKLSETSLNIMKIFSKKIKETINGEIKQNENLYKITDLETYYKKTQAKTGNLFFCGLECLFELKEIDENLKKDLLNLLKNYTLGFQIKNDLDNYKNGATDFKIGNYTLPMIYFFMDNNTVNINTNDDIFQKYIEKSKEKVEELRIEVLSNLNNIQNSIYKTSLENLINMTLRS